MMFIAAGMKSWLEAKYHLYLAVQKEHISIFPAEMAHTKMKNQRHLN